MSSFRNELLKTQENKNSIPIKIRHLLDNGLIQECETIDGIHYILFAFSIPHCAFYNYKIRSRFDDFRLLEFVDVVYTGGFALNDKCKILKGVIYPYYTKMCSGDYFHIFNENMNLIYPLGGTPQVINKSDNISLGDFFYDSMFFKVFNLSTTSSNTWTTFIKGDEDYKNTFIMCDEEGIEYEPYDENDITYYGIVKNSDCSFKRLKRYTGNLIPSSLSIPMSFVEDKLKLSRIKSTIATKIFLNNKRNAAINNAAEIIKEGLEDISTEISNAGINISHGASNIANSLNKHPMECSYY